MELKNACRMCEGFSELAAILKKQMEGQAFRTDNFPSLKLKYEYLTELENLIKNETFEETK